LPSVRGLVLFSDNYICWWRQLDLPVERA
jgi:hypothetical protein